MMVNKNFLIFLLTRIVDMKRTFIQLVKLFEEHHRIEPNYKIISDGYYHSVEELNIQNN